MSEYSWRDKRNQTCVTILQKKGFVTLRFELPYFNIAKSPVSLIILLRRIIACFFLEKLNNFSVRDF